jgi:hypothetical protein
MKPIPILGVGLQSKSSNITAQSRVNCYMDSSDDKNTVVAIGRPGLKLNIAFVDGVLIRAMHIAQGQLWLVADKNVYVVESLPSAVEIPGIIAATFKGSLHFSDGYVEIDDNGLEVIITDNGQYIYTYNLSTSVFTLVTDVDYPYSATRAYQSVCFLDSYILANKPGTAQVQWSSSYDARTWDALDVASAESHPDKVIRVVAQGGYAYVFGTDSVEFWSSDVSGFSAIKGLTLSNGLAAIKSVAKMSDGIGCLTANPNGTSQVSIVRPGNITKISTTDLDSIINDYPDISDATGFSFVLNGHEFYQINFLSGNQSWFYDLTMGIWSEIRSESGRYIGEYAAKLNNRTYVSDYRDNGRIYYLDETINTDNGEEIEFELTSKHVFNGLEKVSIGALQVDAETGILPDDGTYQNSQIMIGISKDNGKTFRESFVSMGYPGEVNTRCRKNRLGMARDWVFKIRITDKIKRVVLGAYVELN